MAFITSAFGTGKWVVTANKALLAEKGNEIFLSAAECGCEIGFEASVCGGIPVIRAIRDGLVGNRIGYILGILNGTSNYILTRMSAEGLPFAEALAEAQAAGFAEADPTFDMEGIDAAHKLCILARLAFGYPLSMADIGMGGISQIEPIDIAFAEELGYKIKLLAVASEEDGVIEARAVPAMLPAGHLMSSVGDVYNAVYIVGDRVGPNLYYGKGAGADPTASAVVSDIVDMALRKAAGCGRAAARLAENGRRVKKSRESVSSFYVRLRTEDKPGVLSRDIGDTGRPPDKHSGRYAERPGRERVRAYRDAYARGRRRRPSGCQGRAGQAGLHQRSEHPRAHRAGAHMNGRAAKYIVIIGDGMADFPIDELGGKTPLQTAKKPNMDTVASRRMVRAGRYHARRLPARKRRGMHVALRVQPGEILYGPLPHRGVRHGARPRRRRRGVPMQPGLP